MRINPLSNRAWFWRSKLACPNLSGNADRSVIDALGTGETPVSQISIPVTRASRPCQLMNIAGALLLALLLLPLLGASSDNSVTIKQMKFTPATLTINPGASVTWTNSDERDHTVTAADGSFSSGKIGAGETFTHKFKSAGNFPYACSYHPRMKGTIVVKE